MVVAPLQEVFALRKRRFTIRNAATADGSARDNRDCRLRLGAQTPQHGETCSHSEAPVVNILLTTFDFRPVLGASRGDGRGQFACSRMHLSGWPCSAATARLLAILLSASSRSQVPQIALPS